MKPRLPILTLTIAAAAVACHTVPGAAEALQFDRAAAGEWWRWVTAHLAHFDANHLAWDLGVFLVLGIWCEWQSRRRMATVLLAAAIVISATLWFAQPQLHIYRGLSGLDSALFGLAAATLLANAKRFARAVGAGAIAGFALKCAMEIATSATIFASGDGYAPVPLSHMVGLTVGTLVHFIPVGAASAGERTVRPLAGARDYTHVAPAPTFRRRRKLC
jgi:rhomboid family GlyGly-CTERM serine protease